MNYLKLCALGALFGICTAQAGIIDNGAPDQLSGVTIANAKTGADDVVLWRDTNILTGLRFWTLEEDGAAWDGNLEFRVYDDAGGSPGDGTPTPLHTVHLTAADIGRAQTASGISLGLFSNLDEYLNTFSFATPLELSGGHYWFALYMQGDLSSGHPEIFWETTGRVRWHVAAQSSRAVPPLLWNDVYHPGGHSSDLAYQLVYDIPAPAPALLMLAGLAAIMGRKRGA